MDSIQPTILSIDTNDAIGLFPRQGFDPKTLLETLQRRRVHVSITELSLAETLVGDPEGQYQRFRRIAEFADLAGPYYFSVGASMRYIIDRELSFSALATEDKLHRYHPEGQARMFALLAGSREQFRLWHQEAVMETASWLNPNMWFDKDKQARTVGAALSDFATPAKAQAWLDHAISMIPQCLYESWVLELLVKDDQLRGRVAREPEKCPTLVALAAVGILNGYGALAGVERGWNRYGWLASAPNNWTDARILAEAAYSDVLTSNDAGLRARALCLKGLKLFKPDVTRWRDLIAEKPYERVESLKLALE